MQKVRVSELQTKKVELRNLEREVQSCRRELIPLTTGKITQIKRDRAVRLRDKVRHRKRCAIKIQALWRRACVRLSLRDPARDYWIECFDEEQGEKKFYYNTWTLETVWKMPPAFRYFHNVDEEHGGEKALSKKLLDQLIITK